MPRRGPKPEPLSERFWEKVKIAGPNDCWLWMAGTQRNGYGNVVFDNKFRSVAHRAAWLLTYGSLPKNKNILHKCDVRNCVNPRHLWVGTQKDNMRDMVAKGRSSPEKRSHLTVEDVKKIRLARKKGELPASIAKKYRLNVTHVSQIISGHRWGHVK